MNNKRYTTNKCKDCLQVKDREHFANGPNKTLGRCKTCRSAYNKKYREEHREELNIKDRAKYQKNRAKRIEYARQYRIKYPERTRATNWKTKYGITPEQFKKKLKQQNGCCAICKRNMADYGKIFCVDHNHVTGKVRGLLCDPCNYGLGFYEKHKEKYREYLEAHK